MKIVQTKYGPECKHIRTMAGGHIPHMIILCKHFNYNKYLIDVKEMNHVGIFFRIMNLKRYIDEYIRNLYGDHKNRYS